MKNCYKKILIMFAMVLTIMSVGIMKNGTIANAATVGQQLTQPEDGWKRYEDQDNRIKYTGSWYNDKDKIYYTNNSAMIATTSLSSVQFKFYGTEFRLIVNKYFNKADNIEVEIDKNEVEYFSEYAPNGNSSTTHYILGYEKTGLEKGIHTVTISAPTLMEGKAWNLDAIDLYKDGYLIDSNQSIKLDNTSLSLKEGTSEKLTATTTPSAVDIDWSSSDETVATIDSNGNVKAIKEGQVTITAQIKGTDIKTNCIVTVTKKDTVPEPTDPEQEYIINTAYAKGDNTNNASGQVSIIFKGVTEAQLKVVKTADVDSVYVGDNFTYTIEVTNTSDKTAKEVVINDSAPNHIQFIPSGVITTQGTIDSNSTAKNIIVNVGDIPPLGKVIIKIPVLVVE